jgi:hypothetical protein
MHEQNVVTEHIFPFNFFCILVRLKYVSTPIFKFIGPNLDIILYTMKIKKNWMQR